MTSHPIPENHHAWWLTCGKWRTLHAIPGDEITRARMRGAVDAGERIPARAACGLRSRWELPGLFSRLGLARCGGCCRALGIPPGRGTPANEADRIREHLEAGR